MGRPGHLCFQLSSLTPAQLISSLDLKFPFLNTIISLFSFLLSCFTCGQLILRAQAAASVGAAQLPLQTRPGQGRGPGCLLLPVLSVLPVLPVPGRAAPSCIRADAFENWWLLCTLPGKMHINTISEV